MFIDRKDAALQLAAALKKYKNKNVVVLGIPRGGAVTGYYIAKYLNAEFSLVISRKIGHPVNPEYAIGAIAEDGTIHLNKYATEQVTRAQLDDAVKDQKKEIARRIQVLRMGRPLPSLANKIVLIVDDGIATGATLFAAVEMCRKQKAAKIVVAAPVSGENIKKELGKVVDEVVVLETPFLYHAVSQAYETFYQVSDGEAAGLMEKWEKEKSVAQ